MVELYRDDPEFAMHVMNSVLEEEDRPGLLVILRQLTAAFGGVQSVAARAKLNPTQLYRTLSVHGNPELSTLMAILKAMGLRLAVQQVAQQLPEKKRTVRRLR
jgi:probable addiction module antidote protein